METIYRIKEENGLFYLMKDGEVVRTPNGSPVCTKKRNLAEWLQWELENCYEQCDHLFYVRYLHYSCCDKPNVDDSEREQIKEWIKEVLYQDPFWGYNESIPNRAMVVRRYVTSMPDMILDLPHHVMMSFINWAKETGSILLPHHVLNALYDDNMYSLDDMGNFIDELIEYGDSVDISSVCEIPWEADYLEEAARTFVMYCSYSEV